MSKDYYKVLGVDRNAKPDEIKKAFHKLAHQYHPDKSGGDEAKFKEINEAYQVLSNPQKKAQYDQFGSAGPNAGFGGQGFGGFDFSGFRQGGGTQFDFDGFDLNDIFSAFTGGGFGRRVPRGRDFHMELSLTFKESFFGVSKKVKVTDPTNGKTKEISVNIPAGVASGQQVRLTGYGEQVPNGQAGNLYLSLRVEKHPVFTLEGRNLVMELGIDFSQAVLGDKVKVTLMDDTEKTIKIPSGLNPGQVLRVRGKGVSGRGDLLIVTKLKVPQKLTKEQKKLIEELHKAGL